MFENYLLFSKITLQALDQYWSTLVFFWLGFELPNFSHAVGKPRASPMRCHFGSDFAFEQMSFAPSTHRLFLDDELSVDVDFDRLEGSRQQTTFLLD